LFKKKKRNVRICSVILQGCNNGSLPGIAVGQWRDQA